MLQEKRKVEDSPAFRIVEPGLGYARVVQPGHPETPPVSEPVSPEPRAESTSAAEARQTPAVVPEPKAANAVPLRGNRKLQVVAAAGVLLAAFGYYGHSYWTTGRFLVSTDDAYVRAHNTTLAAKVAGYVASIPVEDNAHLRAGDVIATIDDGDYKLAVDSAREKAASQQATVQRFDSQIVAQQAAVEQARAQLLSAQAGARRAQLEYERQKALASNQYASQQTYEQAIANRDQANAQVQNNQAAVNAAIANIDVLKAQKEEAARSLEELKTAQAKAERDLSFTSIRAPIDGVFGNRAIQTGDYVQTGQRLGSLVPLDAVYVDANFKETQLGRLKPGQPVSVHVDALPDHPLDGVVESFSPASGAVFSLLPSDNATGNFTKIVQRLPVRIAVPVTADSEKLLRPGLSVVVSINTKPGAPVKYEGERKTPMMNGALPALTSLPRATASRTTAAR
jgi:membrane fusion protein (multidrug efflux system)